jgi:hypothetical protein
MTSSDSILNAIKIVHTVVWGIFVTCILAISFFRLAGRIFLRGALDRHRLCRGARADPQSLAVPPHIGCCALH